MPVGSKFLNLLCSSFHLHHFTVPRLARYSRLPIFDFYPVAASHVCLHFAFTRTQPVFWRRFARQFSTEAAYKGECGEVLNSFPRSNSSHPWPEWSKLVGLLVEKGYSDRCIYTGDDDDLFLVEEDLPEEFLKDARACLSFARERPDILRLLTKKNIEAIVLNGSPFLFKNGDNSSRRMKLFFTGEGSSQELELEKAQTIDIMRYLLSYVYGPLSSSDFNDLKSNEFVERSVRKLLGELFNLSGTIWKLKSAYSTLAEVPLSNQQFRPPGQCTVMRSSNLIYPKSPSQTSESESQSGASFNLIDYEKSMACQRQGYGEKPPGSCGMSMNRTNSFNTLNMNYNANLAEPSSSFLDKNVESFSRAPARGTFNANSPESSTDSRQPPSHLGNNHSYYGEYIGNSNQPSGTSWTNKIPSAPTASNSANNNSSSLLYGEPTATSSLSGSNLRREECCTSYDSFNANSFPPSSNSGGNKTYGAQTAASSQPPSNSWHSNNSYADQHLNSTQPSSTPSWGNNNSLNGGNAMNSSGPPRDSWSNCNTSFYGSSANSTLPTNTYWDDNNRSYGGPTPYSSQPPQRNYNTQYDGAALPNSWNNHVPYDAYTAKSTQPSSNSWSNNHTSFGGPTTNSSQPPRSTWNNYNADTTPNSCYSNDSNVGPAADRNRGYASNSPHPSSNSWGCNTTYTEGDTTNPPAQMSDGHSWHNKREGWIGGIHEVNNVTEGSPTQARAQNACESGGYGYSRKSLEGSCVKEPDPLDMSEEAKAERWFRRAAQIKDISELSQIPDEDFPQIMPMRKGVNRFVVSKRKTPLERRLASQQYKRDFPVVGSEPEKEPTVGEGEPSRRSNSGP